MVRDERFTFKVAAVERQRLDALAKAQGLAASQVIRSLINKAWRKTKEMHDEREHLDNK